MFSYYQWARRGWQLYYGSPCLSAWPNWLTDVNNREIPCNYVVGGLEGRLPVGPRRRTIIYANDDFVSLNCLSIEIKNHILLYELGGWKGLFKYTLGIVIIIHLYICDVFIKLMFLEHACRGRICRNHTIRVSWISTASGEWRFRDILPIIRNNSSF